MIKRIGLAINFLFLFVYSNVFSQDAPNQWKIIPALSIYDIVHAENGKIISSSALPWPDGRSGLILYLRTNNHLYRCVDWKNKDFQNTGYGCYKLVNPNKNK